MDKLTNTYSKYKCCCNCIMRENNSVEMWMLIIFSCPRLTKKQETQLWKYSLSFFNENYISQQGKHIFEVYDSEFISCLI